MNLVLDHIRKAYDARHVLRDCSYAFDRRGTYVLMGRNGSGKSTLLRVCCLLECPDGGEILFQDGTKRLAPDLHLRRRMTLVLPRIGLFNTTVFHNIAYGLHIRGVPRPDIDRKVQDVLAFVGLDQKRDQDARTLSSGESQRIGIARALVIEPEILFLDEPTASVDEENTGIIESIITRMKQELRTTVIMTTHDRDQAERLADVLLYLKDGRIENPG